MNLLKAAWWIISWPQYLLCILTLLVGRLAFYSLEDSIWAVSKTPHFQGIISTHSACSTYMTRSHERNRLHLHRQSSGKLSVCILHQSYSVSLWEQNWLCRECCPSQFSSITVFMIAYDMSPHPCKCSSSAVTVVWVFFQAYKSRSTATNIHIWKWRNSLQSAVFSWLKRAMEWSDPAVTWGWAKVFSILSNVQRSTSW